MDTTVYIDGFNFYYCAVKNTGYKWLDPMALCTKLFPNSNIIKIKYFTAKVRALQHDPGAPTRQGFYWRALKTIPELEIIQGNFVSWPKLLPQSPLAYVQGPKKPPQKVQVERSEEKGSDVNLAAHLVFDNCQQLSDESVVISNDSDLANAIDLVTQQLGRKVTIVNPNRSSQVHSNPQKCSMQQKLRQGSTHKMMSINDSVLSNSQFATVLTDAAGSFTKPSAW